MSSAPLRIAVTADPELPVPPSHYGGIERIIAMLVEGLVGRGHDVCLFAHRDSRVPCTLVPYPGTRSGSRRDTVRNAAAIVTTLKGRPVNVVHSFGRLAYLLPLLPWPLPKIMSYQRAVTARSVRFGHVLSRGTLHFTGCSRHLIEQVSACGSWHVVYNGVPVGRYAFRPVVDAVAPLVFLGRIEHIKGTHLAIEVAKRSRRTLIIAGNVPEQAEHQEYFRSRIQPAIDGRTIVYVGPVDDRQKNELLGSAAALLMPILWDEPFGIVMAEALACGTPVVALRRGSVPEVVDDGTTGFVCDTTDRMVEAVGRLAMLDRARCRQAAEARFSDTAIVDGYEALYRCLIAPENEGAGDRHPIEA